ncbi:MAG: hypothetical protein U0836_19830 [Pirellulales bacterium]
MKRQPFTIRRSTARRGQRRGVVVLHVLVALVLLLLVASLAINWAWLTLVARNLQARADAAALAGAPGLLDEDLLRDQAGDQADDRLEAEALADDCRKRNNAVSAPSLQVVPADLLLTPGVVDDPSLGAAAQFAPNLPYNALEVRAQRSSAGANPLTWLLNVSGMGPGALSVTARAALDNWLVGFQPTSDRRSPVVPLAIDVQAWKNARTQDKFPSGGNGVKEIVVRLGTFEANAVTANSAVIAYTGGFQPDQIIDQVLHGLSPAHLTVTHGQLGPVKSSAAPVVFRGANKVVSSFVSQFADTLQSLVDEGRDARRVFLLYDSQDPQTNVAAGRFRIVGFVAARVCQAQFTSNHLQLTLEPCFLLHPTAWTASDADQPNLYIHKLRIVR